MLVLSRHLSLKEKREGNLKEILKPEGGIEFTRGFGAVHYIVSTWQTKIEAYQNS